MHSYAFPDHEAAVGKLAAEMGFTQVSLSSALVPMVRAVPRGHTASVDSYLTPCIREYLDTFLRGFDDGLRDGVKVSFMQSDGGLTPAERFTGYKAILSGPAGGVVGYAITTRAETTQPVIGFDMGGTSTDVSRFDATYEQVTETETAGVTVQAPQLDINTVAAGRIEAHVQVRDFQGRTGVCWIPARAGVLQERRREPRGDGRQPAAGQGPAGVLSQDFWRRRG